MFLLLPLPQLFFNIITLYQVRECEYENFVLYYFAYSKFFAISYEF